MTKASKFDRIEKEKIKQPSDRAFQAHPSPTQPSFHKTLHRGHSIAISNNNENELIQIRNSNGVTLFTIEITESGTNLNIAAENINLNANNSLNLSGKNVNIASEKDMLIKCNNDYKQEVDGNKFIEVKGDNINLAKTQELISDLGDIKLKANDDIKLNGERVKLNCDD